MHRFIHRRATLTLALLAFLALTASVAARDVTFLHISDQHYDSAKNEKPERFVPTIEAMNAIPGTEYPPEIGGEVGEPRGVVMTGDLAEGKPADMDLFEADWGLTGEDGRLNYPVYEGAGNHDGPASTTDHPVRGSVRRRIIERNQERPAVVNVSENGLHYSWDWDDVHFVMLNEYAGPEDAERWPGNPEYGRKMQNYGNPAEKSLQFLREDLASQVGDSDRPVILAQHYGFGGFPLHPWGNEAAWWTEAHAMMLWEAIEGYNVVSLLAGHDGSEAVIDWNGIPNRHMDDMVRFGVYHLTDDTMTVAQRNSKSEAWEVVYEQPTRIDASLPPELLQGPYLLYDGEPGTMTVLWRTSENVPVNLRWGDDRFEYEDGDVEVLPADGETLLYKHKITGLAPNTSIQYTLQIGDKYAPGMFYSAPDGAKKVKFLVAGAQPDAESRHTLYETLYEKIYEDPAYHSLILHPGDMVSKPNALRSWDQEFFSRNDQARHIRWMLTRAPLAAAPGAGELQQRLFPADGEVVGAYSYDYGPVHVAALNADESLAPGSAQNLWLQDSLEATTATWRVVMWNAPKNEAAEQRFINDLQPICDAWGVDLAVSGGDGDERVVRNTTTYLAPGALTVAVQAEPEALTCEFFEPDGNIVDTTTLTRKPDPETAEVLVDSYRLTDAEIEELAKAPAAIEGGAPCQWRVTWQENPAEEAVVSWSTAEEGADHVLYYDTKSRDGELDDYRWSKQAASKEYRRHPAHVDDPQEPTAFVHHVRLEDLEPSTTYWFTMVSGGEASRELHFVTAPEDDDPFAILAGGDARSRRAARIKSNLLMAELLERQPDILALSHGGDFNDNGARLHDWMLWLTDHELTTTRDGRVLPVVPTRGNHESNGPGYDDVFDFPGGEGKNYLTTDFGPQMALITLNTEIPQGGEQRAWLETQLAERRPGRRWLLTSQHYPNYPAIKGIGGCKEQWVPLFEQYELDLSLESDGHCLKRTMPIRADKPAPDGIVYLGEGGLGAPQRDADLSRWYIQQPAVIDRGDHVNLIDFSEDALRIRTVMVEGGWVYQDYLITPRPAEVREAAGAAVAAR